jgi:hypothetical protein
MFKKLKSLWQASPSPATSVIDDPDLGPLVWSRDSKAWVSSPTHRQIGFAFNIAGVPLPDPGLVQLAKSIVVGKDEFTSSVRSLLSSESKSSRYEEPFGKEIVGLKIESVCLFWPDRPTEAMVFFEGGGEDRGWHCDYADGVATSLVFDT